MTRYNSLIVKLSNLQLNKLKSAIKNKTEMVLRLSSNMIGSSNNKTNFPYELLSTNRHFAIFVKLLQIIHQPISSYQQINYFR